MSHVCWSGYFSKFVFLFSLLALPVLGRSPEDIKETQGLLFSNSSDDRKSGLNRLELLSIDDEEAKDPLLNLVVQFLDQSSPSPAEKFRALEIGKNLTADRKEETKDLRRKLYRNYLKSFVDQARFSLFNPDLYQQFTEALTQEPQVAIELAKDPQAEKIGTYLLRTVGHVASSEVFVDLDHVIGISDKSENFQRIRDEARLAKFAIFHRELKNAVIENNLPKFHARATSALKLLENVKFETRKFSYGASCQVSAKKYVLEYFYWDLRLANKDEELSKHREEFEKLLKTALDSRSDLLDFRIVGILGMIGDEKTLLILEKARGHGDKIFKEFLIGAIRRIKERLKA